MKVIPAIDLLDGEVVRLFQGDYQQKKVYHKDPLEQARMFAEAGFSHLHIVDLNGARSGKFVNLPLIVEMIRDLGITVQTGGGVRKLADVEKLLESGINKVICSSLPAKSPDEWLRALRTWPGQCILGLDLKDGKMAYGGWLETTDQSIQEVLEPMLAEGLREVLSTDISRDGTLEGPNVELYQSLQTQFPDLAWIASGGVSSVEDLEQLREIDVSGVVVGKAYYEGRVTLEELARQSD